MNIIVNINGNVNVIIIVNPKFNINIISININIIVDIIIIIYVNIITIVNDIFTGQYQGQCGEMYYGDFRMLKARSPNIADYGVNKHYTTGPYHTVVREIFF